MDDEHNPSEYWQVIDSPSNPPVDYKPITLDNGSTAQWVYNGNSKNWERIKVVQSWKPQTNPVEFAGYNESRADDDKFNWTTQNSFTAQFEVTVGVNLAVVTAVVSPSGSYTGSTGLQGTYWYDPNNVSAIHKSPEAKFAAIPLAKTTFYVKQYLNDPHAETLSHTTPLGLPNMNGSGADPYLTAESVLFLDTAQETTLSYELEATAAVLKHIKQPGE
jgi:hypothetical protein